MPWGPWVFWVYIEACDESAAYDLVTRSEAAFDLNLLVEIVLMERLSIEIFLLGGICLNMNLIYIGFWWQFL